MPRSRQQAATQPKSSSSQVPDPLDAIPVVPAEVDAKRDAKGCFQIRRKIMMKKGLGNWISGKFNLERFRRINLDGFGSTYWEQVNGRRTLRDIMVTLMAQYGWTEVEAKKAVIDFTAELMRRGLIIINLKSEGVR